MKKLFLLDALALIYRAYYAFINNPRRNSKGLDTSAIYGFTNTLLEVLQKEKPTHIGVAFDTAAPTFRHDSYEEYKAHRQEQPEGISVAIPYIKKLLQAMHIPILEMDGYEADDIIGTLAKRAEKEGFQVYMMTSDKDYCQLVSEHIFLYKPATKTKPVEVMGVPEVLKKFKIQEVKQVIDILALQGDSADNIPGIPGIGEKTAQKLIAQYGSVENLIAHADELTPRLRDKVKEHAQQALLCKELVTIHTEVPIEIDLEALRYEPFNAEELLPLLDELEFRSIKNRLLEHKAFKKPEVVKQAQKQAADNGQLGLFISERNEESRAAVANEPATEETAATTLRNIYTTRHFYHLIDTPELIQLLADKLSHLKAFCFDTETTHIEALQAELVGIAFAWHPHEAYYLPLPEDRKQAMKLLEPLRPVFESPAIIKVAQNLKYDMAVLANYGIQLSPPFYDTMLAAYLLDPDEKHGMNFLAKKFLRYEPVNIETLIGKRGKNQGNMRDVALDEIKEYAAEDADITWQLYAVLQQKMKAYPRLQEVLQEIELPLVPVLEAMERCGIKIDVAVLQQLSERLGEEIEALEQQIYALAGEQFNIASPKQLGEILFDKLKLDKKPKKTPSGQYATGEEILAKLVDKHPIVALILDIRELQKLKSTYVDPLPSMVDAQGKLHTSFNQAVTATGRLSSTNPNLQNIPIRTERGQEIRKAFVPSYENGYIVSADYSQIELRLMAHLSGDPTMQQAFAEGKDIHAITAARIFHVPVEEVTPAMRRAAKTANFGILYGVSAFGLAERLRISRTEAKKIIDEYFAQFPAVREYQEEIIRKAREQGYVETIFGRRRYLRGIDSRNQTVRGHAERNAINTPLQGSAADIIKLAMVKVYDWLCREGLRSKMVLQVHDELLFDTHPEEVEQLMAKVPALMSGVVKLSVPLKVDIGKGANWLEAH
ncbi:DNA polymerase I [Thermonema rossianum]|uniref:DNA polymerase I n=1 Tax=Thermonema rossianum TaxID=55505 RepID=UPI0005716238|nr:DNA polymerase I [Thermonema rossianum]